MYRVFYFTLVSDDMTMWDYIDTDGPTTVAQITGLQAHMTYVIRVQAKSVNERWSNMTEVKIADFTSQGIPRFYFRKSLTNAFNNFFTFEAILKWIFRFLQPFIASWITQNLIDSCQALLPVQYASNIELICQKCYWCCD